MDSRIETGYDPAITGELPEEHADGLVEPDIPGTRQ
jgi:hypothetical protein